MCDTMLRFSPGVSVLLSASAAASQEVGLNPLGGSHEHHAASHTSPRSLVPLRSGLAGNRRQALWQSVAGAPDRGLLRPAGIAEEVLALTPPSEADDIVQDYRALGLTLGRHPLALLREALLR